MYKSIWLYTLAVICASVCKGQTVGFYKPLEDSISLYQSAKKYDKVLPFAEALSLRAKREKGEFSREFASALNFFGDALRRAGSLKESESALLQSLTIRKRLFGDAHPDVSGSFYSLGNLYTKKGNNTLAETYYLQALDLCSQLMGRDHPEVASILYSMGNFYTRLGNFQQADSMYRQAIEIYQKSNGENHISLADPYNGLGVLYNETGDYAKAEQFCLKAIEIWKKTLPENHLDLANPYNNLGTLYEKMGSFLKAEVWLLRAHAIWKRTFGEFNTDVADACNNLGVLYLEMKNYRKSEEYLLTSLEIKRKLLGDANQEMAVCLFNMGNFYYMTSSFKKAEQQYLDALAIYTRTIQPDHPDMADVYNNLASVYSKLGQHEKAEPLYQKSLSIFKRTLGDIHTNVVTSYSRLALLNYEKGDLPAAEPHFLEFRKRQQILLQRCFPFFSDIEKEKFLDKQRPYLNLFKSFCVQRYVSNPLISIELYNQQLATKALLLHSSAKWRQRIKTSEDPVLVRQFEAWNQNQNELIQLFQMADTSKRAIMDSIFSKAERLEKELSLHSDDFTKLTDKKVVTWVDVQKSLKADEAAIEMIRVQKFGIVTETIGDTIDLNEPLHHVKGLTDTVQYVALIVASDSKYPEMVLIENGNYLEEKQWKHYKKAIRKHVPDLQSYYGFWAKIGSKLHKYRTIYFSPDGVYHKINLNTLQNPRSKKYVLEEKEIRLVTVTKDFINPNRTEEKKREACLVGFPQYDLPNPIKLDTVKEIGKGQNSGFWWKTTMPLTELPATQAELEKIGRLLKINGWKTTRFIGANALETSMKAAFRPRLLHVATHGFFQPDSGKGNPLLCSGLMLAGAANTLRGEKLDTHEDGILTSAEAMNLNLENTDLVVLSACETGLGEIKNEEGVYGLQRAFKVAGAQSIIMSLWKVSDVATQELMVGFYKNWLRAPGAATSKSPEGSTTASRVSKRSAFLKAQKELKAKYPNPFYWGAFVMLGD